MVYEKVTYMCPKCYCGGSFNINEEFSTICKYCDVEMTLIGKKFVTSETEKRKQNQQNTINKPKCPTCSSYNVNKISGLESSTSIVMWGIFSKKINKTFKCENCGYTW